MAYGRSARPNINVRLSDDVAVRLSNYMQLHGMSVSQAVRILLELSLTREGVSPDQAYRTAAFREGIMQGVVVLKSRMQQAIAEALRDMEKI